MDTARGPILCRARGTQFPQPAPTAEAVGYHLSRPRRWRACIAWRLRSGALLVVARCLWRFACSALLGCCQAGRTGENLLRVPSCVNKTISLDTQSLQVAVRIGSRLTPDP